MEAYLRPVLVLIFAILQFVTPVIVGNAFDEVSSSAGRRTPIYFVPADYTFGIWGLITLLSAVYAIYQILPNQISRDVHQRIGWFVLINTIFFSIWLILAVQSGRYGTENFQPLWILATVIVIIGMLVMNILIFLRLSEMTDQLTVADRWFVVIPTAVYFGWLTVATIANTTSYLYGIGWSGEQYGQFIAAALLVVAAVIASAVILRFTTTHGAVAYSAVIIWAAIGIAVENLNQSRFVTITALLVAGAILVVNIISVNQPPPSQSDSTVHNPEVVLSARKS
jgi:translocator protein